MKYKLKKWYPGIPEKYKPNDIGVRKELIVEVDHPRNRYISGESFFLKGEVENNPEFWEKVVEKDYEILSFKAPALSGILDIAGYGTYPYIYRYSDTTLFSEKQCLDRGYKIHSVKRLSDGEVFTVGDEVITEINSYCSIYGFKVINNKLKIDCTHTYLLEKRGRNVLESINHVKEPLFTTEDGVDIYEGDSYAIVINKTSCIISVKSADNTSGKEENYTYFSTKEKAEEYIDQHKPRYSKADIREAFNECMITSEPLDCRFLPYKFKDLLKL